MRFEAVKTGAKNILNKLICILKYLGAKNEDGTLDRVIFWAAILSLPVFFVDFDWSMFFAEALIAMYAYDAYKLKENK